MADVEIALAFTGDPWVEELHRHIADHGGARVRTLVVDADALRDEAFDVLVAGHRWAGLTRAVVEDVHARGRAVLGVHQRDEAESRTHLHGLGVDALIESDAGPDAFVRAIVDLAGTDRPAPAAVAPTRGGRLIVVGGAPGSGRTEIAIQLAVAVGRVSSAVLVDADDVAPAVAARLALAVEPNLRTAIDAVEHGIGELATGDAHQPGLRTIAGLPHAGAWAHVRPGEVMRVIDRTADQVGVVVADGAGSLEDIPGLPTRSRHATARALVGAADEIVAVCDGAPHGVARLLGWLAAARTLAPHTPILVAVNRAPGERFRRGELHDEIRRSAAVSAVVFVPYDERVAGAAWDGVVVGRGRFTRAVDAIGTALVSGFEAAS